MLRSQIKFGLDRFSRLDVYRLQTNKAKYMYHTKQPFFTIHSFQTLSKDKQMWLNKKKNI